MEQLDGLRRKEAELRDEEAKAINNMHNTLNYDTSKASYKPQSESISAGAGVFGNIASSMSQTKGSAFQSQYMSSMGSFGSPSVAMPINSNSNSAFQASNATSAFGNVSQNNPVAFGSTTAFGQTASTTFGSPSAFGATSSFGVSQPTNFGATTVFGKNQQSAFGTTSAFGNYQNSTFGAQPSAFVSQQPASAFTQMQPSIGIQSSFGGQEIQKNSLFGQFNSSSTNNETKTGSQFGEVAGFQSNSNNGGFGQNNNAFNSTGQSNNNNNASSVFANSNPNSANIASMGNVSGQDSNAFEFQEKSNVSGINDGQDMGRDQVKINNNDVGEDAIRAFKAKSFEFGKIPEVEPPISLRA